MMKRTPKPKDVIAASKLPSSLVVLIDQDAGMEATSRSHIIRRILTRHYQRRHGRAARLSS